MRFSNRPASHITLRASSAATVVELTGPQYGSADEIAVDGVRTSLLRLADESQPPVLLVDLSKVTYFGARLVGVFVVAWDRLRRRQGRLVLCGLTPDCRRLARALRLDRLFDIYLTQRMALQMLQRAIARDDRPVGNVRILVSDVAWDSAKVRLTYVDNRGTPVYIHIVPREQTEFPATAAVS